MGYINAGLSAQGHYLESTSTGAPLQAAEAEACRVHSAARPSVQRATSQLDKGAAPGACEEKQFFAPPDEDRNFPEHFMQPQFPAADPFDDLENCDWASEHNWETSHSPESHAFTMWYAGNGQTKNPP